MKDIETFNFREDTTTFIELNKFKELTKIQKEVIPCALNNDDIIGISDTGSGKTHAFLIPIFEKLSIQKPVVQAVISTPTRELAKQIYNNALLMTKVNPKIRIMLITGGTDKERTNAKIKEQPHIVIGTPGRLKDVFLNEQTLRLDTARTLVMDEADMIFEFGFLNDVDAIAGRMSKNLQIMSFSATIPQGLHLFLKKYMHQPKTIRIEDDHKFQAKIKHILIPCKHQSYEEKLLEILPYINPYVCIIFANTKKMVEGIAEFLRNHQYPVVEIHGNLSSRERNKALKEMQSMDKSYIVASDLAARGIDIEGVSHVISLGFPKELDFYIHRSGRTGRAGKDGVCYAFYQERDVLAIKQLMKKGIDFHYEDIKNHKLVEVKNPFVSKEKHNDLTEKEIAKVVYRKKQKVKPGYKVKRKHQIEKLKRKAKREFVKSEIQKHQIERAKNKRKNEVEDYENR